MKSPGSAVRRADISNAVGKGESRGRALFMSSVGTIRASHMTP